MRDALLRFDSNYREIDGPPDIRTNPDYPRFNTPQMKHDLPIILKAGADGDFNASPGSDSLLRAILAAKISGDTAYVPILIELAASQDPAVRRAVSDSSEFYYSPLYPNPGRFMDVLMACIDNTEARLPAEAPARPADASTPLPPDQLQPFTEFMDAVSGYCRIAGQSKRNALKPRLDRFLERYKGSIIEEYFRPEFEKMLKGEGFRVRLDGKSSVATERPQKRSTEKPVPDWRKPAQAPNPIGRENLNSIPVWIGVAAMAAGGSLCVFLYFKRRGNCIGSKRF